MTDGTHLLQAAAAGDPRAAHELLPLVYEELRKLAAQKMAQEAPGQTLQATALVHEAWLRLGGDDQPAWDNRGHFFAAAAEAMRRIVIDNARRKRRARHGGDWERVDLAGIQVPAPAPDEEELLAVHEALDELAALDSRKAELVKLRFFVGLSFAEAAQVLGVSEVTAKRDWAFARAWLYRRTGGRGDSDESNPPAP
jgi:RNA polymerase sigma factor (TIGR02999 family)